MSKVKAKDYLMNFMAPINTKQS